MGDRDDVVIRQYKDGKWGALQWVPGTSGDSWLPQIAVDAQNRPWVLWSQMSGSNWDIYARPFDPAKQEWGKLERLTSNPMPDINPRLASDGKGKFALVWQGFRGKRSSIFLRTFDGSAWSAETRVTSTAANDWEPSAAFDSKGGVWIAYDSYRNGNYDVYLWNNGQEQAVTTTPRFEARATVAVDTADRVWVAWESGGAGWGKDQGYILRPNPKGVPLGGVREVRVRVLENGKWMETERPLSSAFTRTAPQDVSPRANRPPEPARATAVYQPHIFSDGKGSVVVIAKVRTNGADAPQAGQPARGNRRGYFEYRATRPDGGSWVEAFALPNSWGRSSTRVNAAANADGSLWTAWSTDNRPEEMSHRPIRQQVYAGIINAGSGAAPVLKPASTNEQVDVPADGHANEAEDLKAIRSYTAPVGGKAHHIVRGDFHRHTELSWDGGGTADGSLQDFYRYMIDAGSMDFGASTDHQGGAWPYWWWYTQKMTDMYHVPGAYVPIFGYERSAVYPNGHRNIFFARRSESRVTPFHLKAGAAGFALPRSPMGDEPGVGTGELVENDTKLLYEDIRPRNGIAISHTSGTRMGTDWRDNDPQLEPVVEIFQGARSNYESMDAPFWTKKGKDDGLMGNAGYEEQGEVKKAWAKGYKLGITSSSDHGSTHISYAMVYTDNPTRRGVLDAIRKRHTYGAMDNIILDVRMGSHFMGDEFALKTQAPMKIKVRATRNIAAVRVIKDGNVIYSATPGKPTAEFDFTDKGEINGRHYYYVRVEQDDNLLAWSSPFFINYK